MDKVLVQLRASWAKMRGDIDAAMKEASRSVRTIRTPVTVDAGRATVSLSNLRRDIARTNREKINIHATGSFGGLFRQLDEARAKVRELQQMQVNVRASGGGFFASRSAMGLAGGGAAYGLTGSRSAGLGGAVGGMMGGGKGALLGGAAGLGAGLAGSAMMTPISEGIRGLAELEKYKSTLGVILRDQKKANDLMADLTEIDMSLPVDLTTLADAATKLAGAGFDPSKLTKSVTTILDAASISTEGTAAGAERITRAFAQMRANGQLNAEELNQISETGIPIRQIIQEKFGMNARDLAEKSQAGEIDIDTILTGILAGFEDRFGGSLKKQADKFSGLLDSVSDKARALSREIAGPLFGPLQDSLRSLIESIDAGKFDGLTAAMVSMTQAAADSLPVIEKLAEMASKIAGRVASDDANVEGLMGVAPSDVGKASGLFGIVGSMAAAGDVMGRFEGFQNAAKTDELIVNGQRPVEAEMQGLDSRVDSERMGEKMTALLANLEDQRAVGFGFSKADSAKNNRIEKLTEVRENAERFAAEMDAVAESIENNPNMQTDTDRQIAQNFRDKASGYRQVAGQYGQQLNKEDPERFDFALPTPADETSESDPAKPSTPKISSTAAREGAQAAVAAVSEIALGMARDAAGLSHAGVSAAGDVASGAVAAGEQIHGVDFAKIGAEHAKAAEEAAAKTANDNEFDKIAAGLGDSMKDFSSTIADPETRKLFDGSTFELKQRIDGSPELALKELGQTMSRGSVERASFDGLNQLVQRSIDDENERARQERALSAQETTAAFVQKINAGIGDLKNAPRTATVGPG